uniref:Elastin microfibril interfacer 3a n=1 Tax=Tetraodon nigroviridis TaxID=99883 RepID=H3D4M5_TETNG
CAYVVEKMVTFTVQDGAAPYVKAEYSRCSWAQKCPTLLYRLLYKPLYKVAHKTVTELEWRCCPGFSGYGCMEEHEHGLSQGPAEPSPEENPPPLPGAGHPEGEMTGGPSSHFLGQTLDNETEERMYRLEEDVQRLSQGLETLRGTVNGLEDSLRASLSPPAVEFGEIPGGGPETEGLDGRHVFAGLSGLKVNLEELRTALQTKTEELQELKAAVLRHDGALTEMSSKHVEGAAQTSLQRLVEAKLGEARAEILGGFEKRVETAEGRCEEKVGDVQRQCQRERGEHREQMVDAVEESATRLRQELTDIKMQIRGLKASKSCCGRMAGLVERVQMLETSVAGLNQSQGHLRVELGGHKDHIEGILEGRLGYVESKLNLTGPSGNESRRNEKGEAGQGLEARMEGKLRAVEERLALLEGHTVPTLETELESIRGRLQVDVDRVQRQISSLELLCTSSCSSPPNPPDGQRDSAAPVSEMQNLKDALEVHDDRLDTLNVTLQHIMRQVTVMDQRKQADDPSQGELTMLKFNIRSVNHTLRDLQDSLGSVVHQVGQANSSWQEREARLAQQIKGVVQLVGHQASMLGAGERRLTRLKVELQEVKKRLAQAVQGCRSTAIGVQKEVTEVGGRVAHVEDQCKGLNHLAEDLERIREELEGQSNGLLQHVNGTLSIHSRQLSELREDLRNCSSRAKTSQRALELE